MAASAAGACGLSAVQLAKLEALDADEEAELAELLHTYKDKQAAQRRGRAVRGEGGSRSRLLLRLEHYPRLLQARRRSK
jgi:hypothetical protein